MKKRSLAVCLLVVMMIICVAGCSSKPGEKASDDPKIEMRTIKYTGLRKPIVSIDVPVEGSYEEIDEDSKLTIRSGEIDLIIGLENQQKYVNGSSVGCTFEEMVSYRTAANQLDVFSEVTYAGMTGTQQHRNTNLILLFPLSAELQMYPDFLRILEVQVAYNVRDENNMLMADQFATANEAVTKFMESAEGKAILNSIKLTAE